MLSDRPRDLDQTATPGKGTNNCNTRVSSMPARRPTEAGLKKGAKMMPNMIARLATALLILAGIGSKCADLRRP
jgi:hypothetical protein